MSGLVEVARTRRVTHIVLAHEAHHGRRRLFARSPAEEIVEQLPEVEVHLTGQGASDADASGTATAGPGD